MLDTPVTQFGFLIIDIYTEFCKVNVKLDKSKQAHHEWCFDPRQIEEQMT